MSHFSVTVLVTQAKLAEHGALGVALDKLLEPFKEQFDEDSDRRFYEFQDTEDEWLQEYETGSTTAYTDGDGWHAEYSEKGKLLKAANARPEEKPLKEIYVTKLDELDLNKAKVIQGFDVFCKEWHGAERDPEKKRYGHWRNPNAKWDWWTVGGRWSGYFPVRLGVVPMLGEKSWTNQNKETEKNHADLVRVGDLDSDRIETDDQERIEKFWSSWTELKSGKEFGPFDGPRDTALHLGLMRIEKDLNAELDPAKERPGLSWAAFGNHHKGTEREFWRDVYSLISKEEFLAKYRDYFYSIRTFAAIDAEGKWHQPGQMGWWACVSDDSPETYLEYSDWFRHAFIANAKPDDFLVLVDCHI